ncbi:MAG: GNAT family N-acetyltransferase [Bacteroidota bacterium]
MRPRTPPVLREAKPADADAIWEIFHAVVQPGTTYAYTPTTTRDQALAYWLHPPGGVTFVAEHRGEVMGTYLLKPVQPGLGDHVANAGFMVAAHARRQGLGRMMGHHALDEARRRGYRAMQFNFVVASNTGALDLWLELGFTVVGTIPEAFRHQQHGLTDIHVLHRSL